MQTTSWRIFTAACTIWLWIFPNDSPWSPGPICNPFVQADPVGNYVASASVLSVISFESNVASGALDKSEWNRIGGLAARLGWRRLFLNACLRAHTQAHKHTLKRIRLAPTIHPGNSGFPAPAATACVRVHQVMLTQRPKTSGGELDPGGK